MGCYHRQLQNYLFSCIFMKTMQQHFHNTINGKVKGITEKMWIRCIFLVFFLNILFLNILRDFLWSSVVTELLEKG